MSIIKSLWNSVLICYTHPPCLFSIGVRYNYSATIIIMVCLDQRLLSCLWFIEANELCDVGGVAHTNPHAGGAPTNGATVTFHLIMDLL